MTVTYPFPTDPAGIEAAGKGALLFVPAIANIAAPTVAEVNAGTNLSCVLYGFNVTPTQNKVERAKYCYRNIAEQLGKAKFEIDALEYDYDPQSVDDTSGDYSHYAKLAPGTRGFLVDRRGLDYETATAAAQVVDVYPVQLGVQGRVAIDPKAEGETLRIRQTVAVVGDVKLDAVIAA